MDNNEITEDDAGLLSSLGFMFDAAHQKFTTEVNFECGDFVRLRMIDGLPGHVQSGTIYTKFLFDNLNFIIVY